MNHNDEKDSFTELKEKLRAEGAFVDFHEWKKSHPNHKYGKVDTARFVETEVKDEH